jgi:putrescine transport system ATP-binding protein
MSSNQAVTGPNAERDHRVEVKNVSAGFGTSEVLHSLSFEIESGHTLVVLGESGCGKTTLLKALAGLIPITAGDIWLGPLHISQLPPKQRGVVYLDQEPLLFEHLSVIDNIGFAMRLRHDPAEAIHDAVEQILKAINLVDHGHKRDWQLSGGQKQRVAFARAVLARPRLLLLDEPFGSLDSKTRGQMQSLFAELSARYRLTSIFVTHDAKEALVIGDRFARMADGVLSLYPDRHAFINDEATGIPAEIAFWQQSARDR